MIYGINFNGVAIPPAIKRKFAAEKVIYVDPPKYFPPGEYQSVRSRRRKTLLKGVATSAEEKDWMLSVADNGHRKFHVEERKTAGGVWYGIYAYYGLSFRR